MVGTNGFVIMRFAPRVSIEEQYKKDPKPNKVFINESMV
jgi:hypothetical protein